MSRADVGRAGEELATRHLQDQGFAILGRNLRVGRSEVDILASDGDTLVVVEVKTRLSDAFGLPEEQISAAKRRRLVECAKRVLLASRHNRGGTVPVRIDIVAITAASYDGVSLISPNVNHLKGV